MNRPLSCFYYEGGGSRCEASCPWPLFFCATHTVQLQRTPTRDLLANAADALLACTRFTETGLPTLACLDFEKWGTLANSLSGLSLHGYKRHEDILTALLSSLLALDSPWKEKIAVPRAPMARPR